MPIVRDADFFGMNTIAVDMIPQIGWAAFVVYSVICRSKDGSLIEAHDVCMTEDEMQECVELLEGAGLVTAIRTNDASGLCVFCSVDVVYKIKPYVNKSHEIVEDIAALKSMRYSDYLKTDHWNRMRKLAYQRAMYRCQLCNASNRKLNAHHRTYIRRGCELPEDLTALCDQCHEKVHKFGIIAHN